ncbi:DUF481 domain-containing protein [Marinobacter fonticola]|uniref:DUF481 domain-containing protein n=1 Tax=Marinobacter fonticola TaxID=2603215 RepID=UPI0011E6FA6E|nr:DUF481 domain-containing protein [Marinobacter fonticola]
MRVRSSFVWAAALVTPLAMAQDAGDEWEGEGELGLLITQGNTEETNFNVRLAVKHEVETWRNTAMVRSLYSEGEDPDTGEEEATAEKYQAEAETNYKFDPTQFLFLRGAYENDRFAAYDFQSSSTAGYGNRVWEDGERSYLDLKAGAGYRFNKLEEPNDDGEDAEDGAVLRFAGAFHYALSPNAVFIQEVGSEVGLEDDNTITESLTAVQADIIGNLSMKVAYRLKHNSNAPSEAESTDTETSLTVLYGF